MLYTIHFQAAKPKQKVILHIWDTAGDIRDVIGASDDSRSFRFQVEMYTEDTRNIQFKFWFPDEETIWESDDYTRRTPETNTGDIWTFEFSPRCMVNDPHGPGASRIDFNLITKQKYAGGKLFIWNPGGTESVLINEQRRNETNRVSSFSVNVEQWMSEGFHFKVVTKDNDYESERSNKVWRRSDGHMVWFKSGQANLHHQEPELKQANIELIYPRTLEPQPRIHLKDYVDDFTADIKAAEARDYDPQFIKARYTLEMYTEANYNISVPGNKKTNYLDLPFSIPSAGSQGTFYAVLGVHKLFHQIPSRSATARVIVYPNPHSQFGSEIKMDLRTGYAPGSRYDSIVPVCHTITAQRQADNTWHAEFQVFANVPHWIDKLRSSDGMIELRPDEAFRLEMDRQPHKKTWDDMLISQRNLQLPGGQTTTIHTADGLSGFATEGGPSFSDMSYRERAGIMSSAFSRSIVDAGVFSPWELPHGATFSGDDAWFVLYAPHAVCADLLVLSPQSQPHAPRNVKKYKMNITHDLRYCWCRISRGSFPDTHNIRYRYLLNNTLETVDPAARSVTQAEFLWADPSEGAEGAWSLAMDVNDIHARFDGSPWEIPNWDWFMIYEIHPLRFTAANSDQRNLPIASRRKAFGRIMYELNPGEYLNNLAVTMLEFLPVNEFPKDISWGYNPAIPFAVESSYGGPLDFAACVRAAHDAGKGVMLDVVFNHMNESPLQATAPDVYMDGETQWGAMINYGHPVTIEYFRQAMIYLWHTFRLDGFRFDATEAIVNGHINNGYIVRDGKVGSGLGWEFLVELRRAVHAAAGACGKRWPYLVAENDPNNWGIDGQALDAQWDFSLQYPLGEAAVNNGDKSQVIKEVLNQHRALHKMVRYAETHDAVSNQEPWKKRIVSREAWGQGMRMAKAAGTLAILAKGVPMLFMGQEAGEEKPFYFGMSDLGDSKGYLDCLSYLDQGTDHNKVLSWFNNILGLRKNQENGFGHNDDPYVGWGNKTLSFTRSDGRFFIIVTLGTWNDRQDLGWLGLPSGAAYKEIFNSSWQSYQVNLEREHLNGGYGAHLTSPDIINLPEIGAVVLERR